MPGKGFGPESRDSVISKLETDRKTTSFYVTSFEEVAQNKAAKIIFIKREEKMNKSELISKIAQDTNLNKKQVEDVLKSLAETIKSEVIGSGEFTLQDVGKFKVNDKPEMERRNPRTGEMFTSPAKKVVKITPAKVLRDAVNT